MSRVEGLMKTISFWNHGNENSVLAEILGICKNGNTEDSPLVKSTRIASH